MNLKSKIDSYSTNQNYKLLNIWMLCLLIGFIAVTIFLPSIGPDSGFYLKIAYDLHHGFSFYKDMNVAYSPLMMYSLSFIFNIFPSAGLSLFYTFIILLFFISAGLFNKILDHFNIDSQIKRLFTLFLLLSLFILEGSNILLEPLVLVFQLLAVLFILRWKTKSNYYWLIGSGVSCFLAFFSKQYGFSVVVGIIWFIYINKSSWKQFILSISSFGSGILVPVLLVILYFNQRQIPANEMIIRMIGLNYIFGNEVVTGVGYNFLHFLESVGRFLTDIPIVLILIPLAMNRNKQAQSHDVFFIILLILGACVQLFFAGYRHYYQLIIPFCLLLIAILIQNSPIIYTGKICRYLFFLSFIFMIIGSFFLIKTTTNRSQLFVEQKPNSAILNQIIPRGQNVYLQGISPAYYYLCLFNSPNFKLLGYRFPQEMNLKYILECLPTGAYIIVDNDFMKKGDFSNQYLTVNKVLLSGEKECIVLQKQ